ncbi:MAG: ATP-binding protein [Anaerolineae bacterium]|jgi:predicted ATPase with chaperone activity|nr:ATP-binding protein [Anaerolineae bacterium]
MGNRKSIKSITQPEGGRPLTTSVSAGGALLPTEKPEPWSPPALKTLEDTGLSKLAVADLVLKTLYFRGDMTGFQIQDSLKVPFPGVLDGVIAFLKREQLIEIIGSGGIGGEVAFRYQISSAGIERALEALAKNTYANIAPVPLKTYLDSVYAQTNNKRTIREDDMRKVMQNLIVSKDMLDVIGPAANSGTSIFLYGPPGNGKTTLSEAIGSVILGEDMWIPYAIDVDGQIILMYDSVNHQPSTDKTSTKKLGETPDGRWIKIKRPIIIVGGELTMESLDLTYDPINKFYQAPYQVKANGGMFLIDDFGRQQVKPMDLLNRWIVPLEKKYDFLTLANGRKIEMPFRVMIIFSTNMDPKDLVDDAFLRRIKYKILVDNPTAEQFYDLFKLMCRIRSVPFDEEGYQYLLERWYNRYARDFRFVHPRDLLSQMKDIASYMDVPAQMSDFELIDRAAASYFVEL